jgi:mRNA interferase RelE/StbE
VNKEWKVIITHRAERDLKRLPQEAQKRIRTVLDSMVTNFNQLDIKKLKGKTNEWRVRVGDWRIRFGLDIQSKFVVILQVLPRNHAYPN